MARLDVNRFGEMDVFARVVELGGFSAAARACQMTPSAVSKLIGRLETRLGTRLVNRSTRKLQLTEEGGVFYDRAVRILADLAEAERIAGAGEQPTGRIRINTSASVGAHILAPLLPEFLARYPAVSLTLVHTDAVIDLMEERVDIAIRAGPMKNSSLIARKLGATRMLIVGSPAYLAARGTPKTVADLDRHRRLSFSYSRAQEGWPLLSDGKSFLVATDGTVLASDGEGLRHLALAGVGLARLARFTIQADLAAGRLVPVLDHLNPGVDEEIYAVHLGQGGPLPARVRVLLDFLAQTARVV